MFSDELLGSNAFLALSFAMEVIFSIAILVSFYRIWRGPSDLDRIVALEFLGGVSIALAAWMCLRHEEFTFLDIALAVSALGFIATASLAKWIERKRSW